MVNSSLLLTQIPESERNRKLITEIELEDLEEFTMEANFPLW